MSKSLGWLLAFACVLLATSAWSAPRGLVIMAEGADAEGLRRDITATVPPGLAVQDATAFTRALEAQARSSLADALANPRTRKQALQSVKSALTKADAQAVLSARTKRGRAGTQEVRLVLVVRAQTEPVIEDSVTVTKDARAKELAPLLGASLQQVAVAAKENASAPPSVSSSSAAVSPRASSNPPNDSEATNPASEVESGDSGGIDRVRGPVAYNNAMVVLEAGVGVARRSFQYNDPLRGALRNYLAPAVGMWTAAGQLYPLAASGLPVAKDLALAGRVEGALPFTSKTKDGGASADASWTNYAVGAHLRVRTGAQPNALLVGIEGVYGGSRFLFSGSNAESAAVANEVPSVNYKFVRGGADVRAPLGDSAALLAGAGYLHVTNAGPFTDRFPRATINGVDARVGASYALAPWLDAKLGLEYTRMFASLKPLPGDPGDIAGGSLDQFIVVNLGASAIF